jgi:3-deoxy-D-manno-octulosonic acid (KDO) 8-phosphate synthase
MKTRTVTIGKVAVGGKAPLVLIAGPCVIESPKARRNRIIPKETPFSMLRIS